MTCVIGLEVSGTVYLGGDSALVDAETGALRIMADPKVFVKKGLVIGCSDNVRIMQLVGHVFKPPAPKPNEEGMQYVAGTFVDCLRKFLRSHDVLDPSGQSMQAQLLLGHDSRLYCIENDFQSYRVKDGCAAIGSGADVALGSLHSTRKSLSRPVSRIRQALQAASTYNAWVRDPFHIIKLGPDKGR